VSKGHAIGKRSVIIALIGNVIVGALKFVAFAVTGSSVLLSEGIHSVADTANQSFLLVGIKRGQKPADESFNYGYRNERFFWSLLSACGVFFLGAGITLYEGVHSLINPQPVSFSAWAMGVLIFSFILEGITLFIAIRELKSLAGKEKIFKYAKHSGDPTLMAIIYEDTAALFGIVIAIAATILTELTGTYYWDALGSILIGFLLAFVAVSLMNINRELLIGRAIPAHIRKKIYTILINQEVVDDVHDFKTVMIATDGYRVKAEVEVNGHYLAEKIFASRDFSHEYENIHNYGEFVKFCSGFSDEVTRTLGKEIDLLEAEIEEEVPSVKHIDIETN
jgi:zinc transporter 9